MKLGNFQMVAPPITTQAWGAEALHRNGGVNALQKTQAGAGLAETARAMASGGTQPTPSTKITLPKVTTSSAKTTTATTSLPKKLKYPTSMKNIQSSGYDLDVGNYKPGKIASLALQAVTKLAMGGMTPMPAPGPSMTPLPNMTSMPKPPGLQGLGKPGKSMWNLGAQG